MATAATGAAAGAATGLPADRCWGEITAPLSSLAALLARVERLPIVGWVVGDAQRALESALCHSRARPRAWRPSPDSGTSKYQSGTSKYQPPEPRGRT